MAAGSFPKIAICAALVAITWTVFGQTLRYDFVNYDDNKYVYENVNVSRGLSIDGVKWAFTHFDQDNWHPLTSISHMIDCAIFGMNPNGHHLTNVILHTIAVILLFLVLNSVTGSLWPSAFVAALFATHPLHVESVAWIAERKDVLSAVFFILTIGAYARYAERPTIGRYIITAVLFVCGLMSKAMLVTVPIILLFLDYWPLKRFQKSEITGQRAESFGKLVLEKIPLLVLSAGSAIATLLAQQKWEIRLQELGFSWRFANAASTSLLYVWQMFWPARLAVLYPMEQTTPVWQTTSAVVLLIVITVGVFLLRRTRPYSFTGWCWYLIMLAPILGFIKVGGLAHADRYTYLPQIGLYLAVTFWIVDLAKFWRPARRVLPIAASLLLILFASRAWSQTRYWRNGETLWRHAIETTKNNDLAHFAFADFLATNHRSDEAIAEYEAGLSIDPDNADAQTELANLLLNTPRVEDAVALYRNALRLDPNSPLAHYNLAVGLHRLGRLPEAIAHYKEALRLQPDYPDAEYFLNQALTESGEPIKARPDSENR